MKPEEQRIAIAEACGWKLGIVEVPSFADSSKMIQGKCWLSPNGTQHRTLPDYLNDLNAMHEAWGIMPPRPFTDYFNWRCELAWQLILILKRDYNPVWPRLEEFRKFDTEISTAQHSLIAMATAAQRAEAFLRTIGKWKEGCEKL